MLKRMFFVAAALFSASVCFSQVKYQGHLGAGYGAGIGKRTGNNVNVETVHGVRVNPYLFGGVGAGINYWHETEEFNSHFYANVRGYLFDKPVTPYLSMDVGYGLFEDGGGLYTMPVVGVNCRVAPHYALAFGIGLQTQRVGDADFRWMNKNVVLRIELTF